MIFTIDIRASLSSAKIIPILSSQISLTYVKASFSRLIIISVHLRHVASSSRTISAHHSSFILTLIEIENSDRELKRLGFVRMIAINALFCVSNLYEYAKQNSGPLKSTVGTVESAVTTVVGPVYEKFKGVPSDLLVFLDEKADEAANKFDERAPPSAKMVVDKAQSMVQNASHVAQTLVQEAQVGGPSAAIHYVGTVYVSLFLSILARFWYVTNQFPVLHVMAQMAIPRIAHWSEKYNKRIGELSSKGYTCFSYFPQVPVDEIAKAYKQVEAEKGPACAPCAAEKETEM
ncbi:hypothetical protein TEA_001581 [Camellia sinensis var. sinensis]|uniref:REF/SRPP-like protein n=1 Tax=Camellia sinensis var. sinensis TaxID=542762 RepID=A0A4S4DAJ4_CAMSN|nr:hypothetical protein TEA_001581 [Camellia sinensis var. sinensis]